MGDDGIIYFAGWDDRLYAINPDGTQEWLFQIPWGLASMSSPAIGTEGSIYVGLADTRYAIYGDSNGLLKSPWPMFNHDDLIMDNSVLNGL
ncbi:MAG: hypothetical protein KKC76_19625 [Proteobacteria bacterium]|nr:hypothetical protein [Pseudomonadota bacterium]MBU4296929.1 hypothetical protein [Pseudomonadota bacterium]